MTDDDLLALLDRELGPVLTPAGFSGAQGGWGDAVFCAPQQEFNVRYEWLPQAHLEEWQRGASTDLVLEFDQMTGLLAGVRLEHKSLAATLYAIGEGALSADLKAAYAKPLAESLPVVAQALGTVLTEPTSRDADARSGAEDDVSWA